MTATQVERLPEEILAWQRVLTHVHTAGSSNCSGQQTLADVECLARDLGFEAVVLAEHTGNPERPKLIDWLSPEAYTIKDAAVAVKARYGESGFIRYGLECNTVPIVRVSPCLVHAVEVQFRLDTIDDILERYPSYLVGSLHGDAGMYKDPITLMTALRMLCENPYVDVIGHITRHVSDVNINWTEVAQMLADTGTILELNQNLWFKECRPKNRPEPEDSFNPRFHRCFVESVAGTSVLMVIASDSHNEGMWPTANAKPGDWQTSVESVIAYHEFLAGCGLSPVRILNSNLDMFDRTLATSKGRRPSLNLA